MNALWKLVKTTLLGGILVLVPLLVLVVLLQKAYQLSAKIVAPVANMLPQATALGDSIPYITAILLILLFCFLAGLLARTVVGSRMQKGLERTVLGKIPGFTLIRGMVSGTLPSDHPVEVGLVEMEAMQCIGFVMERHSNGFVTLFVPSAPTPTAGSVFFVEASKVRVVDVSIKDALHCISRLGVESGMALQRALTAPA